MNEKNAFGINAKLEIKTEIPSDASGRLVHVVADAVSPLTEWLGLQGDKIRIHRMRVVEKFVGEAEKRISTRGVQSRPIPLKIAVRLIELASQEELDDDFMIQAWAGLLASAASDVISPRFVSLLAELNGRQAALLTEINARPAPSSDVVIERMRALLFRDGEAQELQDISKEQIEEIENLFGPGIVDAEIYNLKRNEAKQLVQVPDQRRLDLGVLESLGLVTLWRPFINLSEVRTQLSNWSFELRCQRISYLGTQLLRLTKA